jgi:hypothetical protein
VLVWKCESLAVMKPRLVLGEAGTDVGSASRWDTGSGTRLARGTPAAGAPDRQQAIPFFPIIEANCGLLWGEPTYNQNAQANHAVTVTGAARDPKTSEIQGLFIDDSGTSKSALLINASALSQAWLDAGDLGVVADAVRGNAQRSAP